MISLDDLAYIANELCENDNKYDDDLVYDTLYKMKSIFLKSLEQRLPNYSFTNKRSFKSDYD